MRRTLLIPALLLLLLLLAFRAIAAQGFLPNFSPLPALLLCSVIFLNGRLAWVLPALAWGLTDPLVSVFHGYPLLGWHHAGILLGIGACVPLALWLRRHHGLGMVLLGSVSAAVLFYFFSNLQAFVLDPLYPKTLAGFVQAEWSGPVGYGPTWIFLRNLVAANLLFSSIFLAARHALPVVALSASSVQPAANR